MNPMRNIPFIDLKAQYRSIEREVNEAIQNVIRDSAFVGGRYVKEFEERFAAYCGVKHCVGTGNGTDALYIALKSIHVGKGDEVIIPANSFIATSEAVTRTGATPVFIDCDPVIYNMAIAPLKTVITKRTKAIVPVHLYGCPVNINALKKISKEYGTYIIQDCAQAHGALYEGKTLPWYGDIACFSFYPGKNLGAYGDAGALVTQNDDVGRFCAMFTNHGRFQKYEHEFEGINSRLDGIQAAVLNVKLNYLDRWTERRVNIAEMYEEVFYDMDEIITPHCPDDLKHVFHLYVIRVRQRDQLQVFLKRHGIETGIHYPIALPNQPAYRCLGHRPEDFPVATLLQHQILSLPLYPELTNDQVQYIASTTRSFFSLKH